jgi:hypothetical protein
MEPKKLEWRDNLHKIILALMKWEIIPQIIINAIDAAYVAGLDDGKEKV